MPEFTKTDRALLIRVGGHLRANIEALQDEHGRDWGASDAARAAKKAHTRLVRDLLDLEALRRRLDAQRVPDPDPDPNAGLR